MSTYQKTIATIDFLYERKPPTYRIIRLQSPINGFMQKHFLLINYFLVFFSQRKIDMLHIPSRPIHYIIALALMPLIACTSPQKPTADEAKAVVKKFEEAYADQQIKVQQAQAAPIDGFYELILDGKQIVYVDKNAKYMLVGDLLDIQNKRSLTAERIKTLNAIDYSSLPLDKAIKEVRGDGKLQVAVFSDPDCPFCKKLEQEFAKIDNITIYNFMMPIPSIHANAQRKAEQIWCQPDRTLAWTSWMREGKLPPEVAVCDNPIQETMDLGVSLEFNGTPAVVFPNGQTLMGYRPASVLLPAIEENQ